jgi:hypothetical protein
MHDTGDKLALVSAGQITETGGVAYANCVLSMFIIGLVRKVDIEYIVVSKRDACQIFGISFILTLGVSVN